MKYEGLFILEAAGREEDLQMAVDRVKHVIESAGGAIVSVQKMDKRPFARATSKRSSGYYVNIIFDGAPTTIQTLRSKFALDTDVFRVLFMRATEPQAKQPSAVVSAKA